MSDSNSDSCAPSYLSGHDAYHSLRIAAIFIIFASSGIGAFFPLLAKRTLRLPGGIYEFAKYFGSGVIIATAFIHLLSPGIEELGSPCLPSIWQVYPWALAISMMSVFFIFFVELFAFRWGTARLKRLSPSAHGNETYDAHGHGLGTEGSHAAHGPEPPKSISEPKQVHPPPPHHHHALAQKKSSSTSNTTSNTTSNPTNPDADADADAHHHHTILESHPLGQVLSIIILEFGVLFHSFIVGLTLAVSVKFIPLLCVLAFHQLFEGLGLGTRLAYLTIFTERGDSGSRTIKHDHHHHHHTEVGYGGDEETAQPNHQKISRAYALFPYLGALFFSLSTPIGIAIGLGVQHSYSPDSTTASIVSGVLDSFSSGILLYTGLVELLAHEFLFSKSMLEKKTSEVAYAGGCVLLGAGLMSLLGRWA